MIVTQNTNYLEYKNKNWVLNKTLWDDYTQISENIKELKIINQISKKTKTLPLFFKSNNCVKNLTIHGFNISGFEPNSNLEYLIITKSYIDILIIPKTLKYISLENCIIKNIIFEEGIENFYITNSIIETGLLNLPQSIGHLKINNVKARIIINSIHINFLYLANLSKSFKLEFPKLQNVQTLMLMYMKFPKIDLSLIKTGCLKIEWSNLTYFKLPNDVKEIYLRDSYITPQPINSRLLSYRPSFIKTLLLDKVEKLKIYTNSNTDITCLNLDILNSVFIYKYTNRLFLNKILGKTSIIWDN